jgi:hypothetical protein
MQYMLLIYVDEQALSEAEREQCYEDSARFAHRLNAGGRIWPPRRSTLPLPRPACGFATANDS